MHDRTRQSGVTTQALAALIPARFDKPPQEYLGKIVFDLDDTAYGLNSQLAQFLGIDYEDIADFHALENTRLPMEIRVAINNCYSDLRFFQNIKFYPGFERIMELEQKYPVLCQIKSNSFNKEICDYKFSALRQQVPQLPPEQICLDIVSVKNTTKKRFDDDIIILVEDSPYNIALSPAKLNILPTQPWNQTAKALDLMKGKPIRFVPPGDFAPVFQAIDEFFASYLPAA